MTATTPHPDARRGPTDTPATAHPRAAGRPAHAPGSRLRPSRAVALAAVPLLTAGLLAWHPADPALAVDLLPVLPRWLAVHAGLLAALPVVTLLVLRLLRGVGGRAATVARIASVVTAAVYGAFESLVGLGTGVLTGLAWDLPADEREAALQVVQAWWEVPVPVQLVSTVAIAAWVTTFAATAVALRRAGRLALVVWSLLAAALLFAAGHPGLTGAAAMVALAVAVVADERDAVTGPGGARASSTAHPARLDRRS